MIVTQENLHKIGPILRRRRIKYGVKQYELADKANYTYPKLSEFEHGKIMPKVSTLIDLCDQLGLELVLREKRA